MRDHRPAARHVGEQVAAALETDHVVLDPHAARAVHIRARLDREDHSRLQAVRARRLGRPPAALVHVEPQSVSRPVSEHAVEAVSGQGVAGRGVDFSGRHLGRPAAAIAACCASAS